MKLLYRTAEWHALAKARMHTESSLELLDKLTTEFGQLIRWFRDLTCSVYDTMELPGETAARVRRTNATQVANATAVGTTASTSVPTPELAIQTDANFTRPHGAGRRTKTLNLNLYKLHSLGDYVASIRMFGTTDSYSTQLVRWFRAQVNFRTLLIFSTGRTCSSLSQDAVRTNE